MNRGLLRGLPGWEHQLATVPVAVEALELDYVQITANKAIAATSEATATTIATSTALTFDGRTRIVIEFYAEDFSSGGAAAADDTITLVLYEDGASIGQWAIGRLPQAAGGDWRVPIFRRRRRTPTSGSHTYSVRAFHTTAGQTASLSAGAGGPAAVLPSYLRLEVAA